MNESEKTVTNHPVQAPSAHPVQARSRGGGASIGRLLLLGLVVGAAVVLVKQLPDLNRYMKIKKM
ncbi:MAG TPA: hypothetical protein VGM82_13060 [Gemmatimonadaceae bacterium]|jgi:hypothetical protein